MLQVTADAVALISVAGLWGGMIFFAAVYAPLIFKTLPADTAKQMIRRVFPVYYLVMGVVSAIGAIALALGSTHGSTGPAAMAVVCGAFWFARQVLMPRINRARDDSKSDDDASGMRFKRLHRISVVINAIQLVVVLYVLLVFV